MPLKSRVVIEPTIEAAADTMKIDLIETLIVNRNNSTKCQTAAGEVEITAVTQQTTSNFNLQSSEMKKDSVADTLPITVNEQSPRDKSGDIPQTNPLIELAFLA